MLFMGHPAVVVKKVFGGNWIPLVINGVSLGA